MGAKKKQVSEADSLRHWCAFFQKSNPTRARLVLSNILYDCRERRIDAAALRFFRSKVNAVWPSSAKVRGKRVEMQVDSLVGRLVHENPELLLCQGSDRPVPADCSRIVDARDFLEHNIKASKAAWSFPCETETKLRQLERRGLRGLTKGEIKGRLPVAWVTKTAEVNKLRRSTEPRKLADRIRDALGLSHFHEDEVLVEIVYPTGEPPALRAPTFLEGDGNLLYRSERGSDQWGRAIDLATMAGGLPEAVHRPVKFTAAFKVRTVGRLSGCAALSFSDIKGWQGCSRCAEGQGCEVQDHVDSLASSVTAATEQ